MGLFSLWCSWVVAGVCARARLADRSMAVELAARDGRWRRVEAVFGAAEVGAHVRRRLDVPVRHRDVPLGAADSAGVVLCAAGRGGGGC